MSHFAERVRAGERTLGYWCVLDSPVSTERVARLGYDYVALDAQHGLMGYSGWLSGLMAIDAASLRSGEETGVRSVGMVRVPSNDARLIGQALDAGAQGVIVPMIDDADQAAAAVAATRYPPVGSRSYGPMRSGLRIGPMPSEANERTLCFAMIETPSGLTNVEEICRTPGLDGVYIGPSDLRIAIGGASPSDPTMDDIFDAALECVLGAARSAGIVAGIHSPDGDTARRRLDQGFTLVSIASELVHLEQAARDHLDRATF